MPFEVHPVEGPSKGKIDSRTAETVASEIKQIYKSVAAASGHIIAGHTISYQNTRPHTLGDPCDRPYTGESVLFLVADLPDTVDS